MKVVWKFELKPGNYIMLAPAGSRALSAQMQDGVPVLWMLVERELTGEPQWAYEVTMINTGYASPSAYGDDFVATVQVPERDPHRAPGAPNTVWHVFVHYRSDIAPEAA